MGQEGAACFHTLSDRERELTKAEWDAERFGMICGSAQTFADWKAAIEKLCQYSERCSYEVQKVIQAFGEKLDGQAHRTAYRQPQ